MILMNGKPVAEAGGKDGERLGHPGDTPRGVATDAGRKARIMRVREVCTRTGLARTTIWTYAAAGTFPKPIRLGPNAAGWLESEVDAWIDARIAERGAA